MAGPRVVVTGLGAVSPLGTGTKIFWERLLNSDCRISSLLNPPSSNRPSDPPPDPSNPSSNPSNPSSNLEPRWDEAEKKRFGTLPSTIAAVVERGGKKDGLFNPLDWLSHKDIQDIPLHIQYAMVAATEALTDAKWLPTSQEEKEFTGVAIGNGIGSISEIVETSRNFDRQGLRKVSPYFVPKILVNMAAGNISIKYGLLGPNHSVSTACATGAHAIGDAYRMILFGDAKVMLAGGCESSIDSLSIAGFSRMRALSTKYNLEPTKASRPFDSGRNGFVIGEGAGVVVLEELNHALSRKATIYAELSGYGLSGDAYHITSPSPEARGAVLSMKRALRSSRMDPSMVDYVNAHATSTPVGDEAELRAIESVFAEGPATHRVAVSSIKGSIGHLLGAAGAVEAIATILAVQNDVIPPSINLVEPIAHSRERVELVANQAKRQKIRAALTNSFGFGGTNASLLFKKYVP